jgi:hypothetical protein
VSLNEIAARVLEFNVSTKVFEEEDSFMLEELLKNKKCSLLVLDKMTNISSNLLKAIKEI